ncbi:hypothetical protein A2635_05080 [Candidatus Peribacteria bacterium RIFCSPHIGHO2_01_FULL_51_9]|nr:MAG: hypothetical protein A2635_05080 [Candidatus Peribacteria bacterium RIFCSPHIGHO2_01_FULL_51_9]
MKNVLKAYWPSLCHHRYLLMATIGLMTVNVVLSTAYPFLLRELLNAFTASGSSGVSGIGHTMMLIVALIAASNVAWVFFDYFIAMFESLMMRDLDQRSFSAIQAQSMRFFESSFTGSLVKYATRFRNAFEGIADALFFQIGRSFLLIILTLIIFVYERPVIALGFSAWVIVFMGVSMYCARLRFPLDAASAEADSVVGGALADSVTNQVTVKSYGQERAEQRRFGGVVEKAFLKRKRAWMIGIFIMRAQGIVVSVFEVLLIWWLALGLMEGTVTVGDFVFFQTYVLLLMHQLWDFGNMMHRLFQRLADAKEMADIFALAPEVRDAPGARSLTVENGEIEFHAMSFGYSHRETHARHAVRNFSLRIPSGQTVALVGPSGAGKSTVFKLLMRCFDLNSGYIRIDRQDIANVTQESLRQQIALVPQQPELFHRSLRDNIAFARPDATEEEVMDAAKRAHAWEFIQRLPDGLATLVGERGVKLSGGERQRIALARAFLADAPILILDEATSALDSKTEKLIQKAIADLLKGRTCIVIAHRLSTIMKMDRIIVMEEGSIVEDGDHLDLLSHNGTYAELWAHQSGGYISA